MPTHSIRRTLLIPRRINTEVWDITEYPARRLSQTLQR